MHITLIGMSSIGKSHWAERVAAGRGFELIGCDRLIEQKLHAEGIAFAGTGTRGMAEWMGQPFDPQYPEASRAYVACEKAVMYDIVEKLRAAPSGKSFVIDTAGSVIYTGDDILDSLKTLTKVFYFEASRAHVAELLARDAADPKPLIWDNAFVPQPGERPEDARTRCYPELLESRARRYAAMAHVTIPFEQHRQSNADLAALFGLGA